MVGEVLYFHFPSREHRSFETAAFSKPITRETVLLDPAREVYRLLAEDMLAEVGVGPGLCVLVMGGQRGALGVPGFGQGEVLDFELVVAAVGGAAQQPLEPEALGSMSLDGQWPGHLI